MNTTLKNKNKNYCLLDQESFTLAYEKTILENFSLNLSTSL